MKRSWLKRKTPLKAKTGFKQKIGKPMRRTRLRVAGTSTVSQIKRDIQALLREIVILRDKKCILYGIKCNHEYGVNDDGIVWQAEHLIERSNSATYGDTRLVVLVCKNCHGWKHFKKSNHDQYDKWVKTKLSPERVKLWEACEADSWRANKIDWQIVKVGLEKELKELKCI
jgi:hypothetical protein